MSEVKLIGFFCGVGPTGLDNPVAIWLDIGDTNFRGESECKNP